MIKIGKVFFAAALATVLFATLVESQSAEAQEFRLGGHVGALGLTGEGASASTIAYGVNALINPFDIAAFQLDATFGRIGGGQYFSTSPAIVIFLANYSEFRMGFLGGPGFYKIPGLSTKFGLHIGVMGEFNLSEHIFVGMESRYHPVFGDGAPNVWNVFVTAGFRFENGGW